VKKQVKMLLSSQLIFHEKEFYVKDRISHGINEISELVPAIAQDFLSLLLFNDSSLR